jgi:dipeptidyl aminopeptidase/acylaminoacyl peptidase
MNPALQAAWRGFIGSDPSVDLEPWRRASPIAYVTSVQAPAWLNQGMFDTRTPPRQAQHYADALSASGGDVLLDWFPSGHMPTGLVSMRRDYLRMTQLTDRALIGERWDQAAPFTP